MISLFPTPSAQTWWGLKNSYQKRKICNPKCGTQFQNLEIKYTFFMDLNTAITNLSSDSNWGVKQCTKSNKL